MILLVNIECSNGHPLAGTPHEYPGPDLPPDKWMDNISRRFYRGARADPELQVCKFCGEAYNGDWRVVVGEMKAKTMEEAHADLLKVGKLDNAKPSN